MRPLSPPSVLTHAPELPSLSFMAGGCCPCVFPTWGKGWRVWTHAEVLAPGWVVSSTARLQAASLGPSTMVFPPSLRPLLLPGALPFFAHTCGSLAKLKFRPLLRVESSRLPNTNPPSPRRAPAEAASISVKGPALSSQVPVGESFAFWSQPPHVEGDSHGTYL